MLEIIDRRADLLRGWMTNKTLTPAQIEDVQEKLTKHMNKIVDIKTKEWCAEWVQAANVVLEELGLLALQQAQEKENAKLKIKEEKAKIRTDKKVEREKLKGEEKDRKKKEREDKKKAKEIAKNG